MLLPLTLIKLGPTPVTVPEPCVAGRFAIVAQFVELALSLLLVLKLVVEEGCALVINFHLWGYWLHLVDH
jgi:hypothetical protein